MSNTTDSKNYTVSGQVFNQLGEPVMNQQVLAVDVDLRGAAIFRTAKTIRELESNRGFEFLGKAVTNSYGYYEVNFSTRDFRKNEIALADVIVFALDLKNNIIARSKLATENDYKGNSILHWDILLTGSHIRGVTEYTRLMQIIKPFMDENKMQLFELAGSQDQTTFLATETRQNQRRVAIIVSADKMRNDNKKSEFSTELLYGIGRQNIGLTTASLASRSANELLKAIHTSVSQNIISAQDQDLLDTFIEQLGSFMMQGAEKIPETANLFKAAAFTTSDSSMQKTFAKMYLQFKGAPEDFWPSLSKQKGFTTDIVSSLQLTNQLSTITSRHLPLIEELQKNRKIKDPSELLEIPPDEWMSIIKKVGYPDSAVGETEKDKTFNYINVMQGLLVAAYPTKKISLMIAQNQIAIKDAAVKQGISEFFRAAKDFDIANSKLSSFDNIIQQVAEKNHESVLQHLQVLQRVYQLSSTPEIMSALIGNGFTSAYQIARMPRNSFVTQQAKKLGGADVAISVYNRAQFQLMRAQQILFKIRDTQDKTIPCKIVSASQQQAVIDTINNSI